MRSGRSVPICRCVGWGVSVDAHPNPGSGVQHCWAGRLGVLRTTYCPDGLSGVSLGGVHWWGPALRAQCCPARSELWGGLHGCRCTRGGWEQPVFVSLGVTECACFVGRALAGGSRKRIRKRRGLRREEGTLNGLALGERQAGSCSRLGHGGSVFQGGLKADGERGLPG